MAVATGTPLFFDCETVPDYSRMDTFGLPPVMPPPMERTFEQCPPHVELLKGTIDEIKDRLSGTWPIADWCALAVNAEKGGKNRAGVHTAINEARNRGHAAKEAMADRCKLLSTCPEFCRVAALGWAEGGSPVESLVAQDPADEITLLDKFWSLVSGTRPVIGYNVIGFDLPVILIRSAILDLPPLRHFDLKPWGGVSGVIDLYLGRFGSRGAPGGGKPGKLKDLARLMGIPVPAGDCDGSQVNELLRTSPEKVGRYVESDVEIVRDYYSKLAGFFWH